MNKNSALKHNSRRGWPPERREKQAARLRAAKIWTRSTGPKTVEGKAICAANARKHGFYDQGYRALRAALRDYLIYLKQVDTYMKNKRIIAVTQENNNPYAPPSSDKPVHIIPAAKPSPLIVVCPHAGIYTPPDFKDIIRIPLQDVLARGDRYTDTLSRNAPDHGAGLIISTVAPAYLNVGRSVDSIHPADVRNGASGLACNANDVNVNTRQGQGLVATKTLYDAQPIYKEGMEPDAQEIRMRIQTFYAPFHETIKATVENNLEKFGISLLFDIHSCPDIGTPKDPDPGIERADIILGDRNGLSCDLHFVDLLETIGRDHGFSVKVNNPYPGGFNTKYYGHTGPYQERKAQALQIEWNRKTMGINQQTFEILNQDKFDAVAACHDKMIRSLAAEF